MPKLKPLGTKKIDYVKNLGIDMDSVIKKSSYNKEEIGKMTGIKKRMVYEKIRSPNKISLEWLKMFIQITEMSPDIILEYLYEGKYKIQKGD